MAGTRVVEPTNQEKQQQAPDGQSAWPIPSPPFLALLAVPVTWFLLLPVTSPSLWPDHPLPCTQGHTCEEAHSYNLPTLAFPSCQHGIKTRAKL